MNEYYFTDEDPIALFDKIHDISITSAKNLDEKTVHKADELAPVSKEMMERGNPKAKDFQKTFETLSITPELDASQYMRIILVGKCYDMYENVTKLGSKLDGLERFEGGSLGLTGKKTMLEELVQNLEHSRTSPRFQPWIVISQKSYEPEVTEICERYKR